MKSDLVAVGALIRQWRKYRKMTLDDLSNAIYKSKATVSKYENGEITMDLSTLYDISRALNIEVHQLLVTKSDNETVPAQASRSSFWSDANKLYVYYYDHRITRIIPGILEITEEMNSNKAGAILYMDYNQLEFYHVCASTYTGYVEYFDSLTHINMRNELSHIEPIFISVLDNYTNSSERIGLMTFITTAPLMPGSTKILLSKLPVSDPTKLKDLLLTNKQDIVKLKARNIYSVAT